MNRSNKDVYPVTWMMEEHLATSRGNRIVEDAIEYMGEVEHDPSMLIPEEYEGLTPEDLTEEQWKRASNRINERVALIGKTVTDFTLYLVMKSE